MFRIPFPFTFNIHIRKRAGKGKKDDFFPENTLWTKGLEQGAEMIE